MNATRTASASSRSIPTDSAAADEASSALSMPMTRAPSPANRPVSFAPKESGGPGHDGRGIRELLTASRWFSQCPPDGSGYLVRCREGRPFRGSPRTPRRGSRRCPAA